jgi:hypothetical protein
VPLGLIDLAIQIREYVIIVQKAKAILRSGWILTGFVLNTLSKQSHDNVQFSCPRVGSDGVIHWTMINTLVGEEISFSLCTPVLVKVAGSYQIRHRRTFIQHLLLLCFERRPCSQRLHARKTQPLINCAPTGEKERIERTVEDRLLHSSRAVCFFCVRGSPQGPSHMTSSPLDS